MISMISLAHNACILCSMSFIFIFILNWSVFPCAYIFSRYLLSVWWGYIALVLCFKYCATLYVVSLMVHRAKECEMWPTESFFAEVPALNQKIISQEQKIRRIKFSPMTAGGEKKRNFSPGDHAPTTLYWIWAQCTVN